MLRLLFVTCAATALFFLNGCGASDPAAQMIADSNKTNVQRLANLYHMYQSKNNWVGPESVEDFKSFLGEVPKNRLEMLGISPTEIDGLFVSERDGQEFKFRFGVQGSPMGSVEPVVFEQTGVDGVRMVGFTSLKPKAVSDQSEYDDLMAGKFVKPSQNRENQDVTPPRN